MTTLAKKRKRQLRSPGFFLALAILAISGISDVSAQETGDNFFLDRPFYLAAGGFFAFLDSEARLDPSQTGGGTTVDLQDDLGVDDTTASPWLQARWRFARHHMVEFEGIKLGQDGFISAQRTLTIGDTRANVGASLDSEFDLTIGRITYGWSFLKEQDREATFLVGAHVAKAELSVLLSGNIEDANTGGSLSGTIRQEAEDVTVPLPHFGGRYSYALNPRLVVDASALAFYLEFDDVKGRLIELQANVQYLFWENVALGGGLRFFNVNVEDDQSNGSNEFDYNYWGPVVFVAASF